VPAGVRGGIAIGGRSLGAPSASSAASRTAMKSRPARRRDSSASGSPWSSTASKRCSALAASPRSEANRMAAPWVSMANGFCPVMANRTAQPWPLELPSGGQ
jgi:hypothetical protein